MNMCLDLLKDDKKVKAHEITKIQKKTKCNMRYIANLSLWGKRQKKLEIKLINIGEEFLSTITFFDF